MARYIDVEGYQKLFDEEYKKTRKLISEGKTHLDNLAEGFSEASRVIDRMPTADVVEVVRCKDCEYCRIAFDPKTLISVKVCGYVGYNPVQSSQVTDNDFCSHGAHMKGGAE